MSFWLLLECFYGSTPTEGILFVPLDPVKSRVFKWTDVNHFLAGRDRNIRDSRGAKLTDRCQHCAVGNQ